MKIISVFIGSALFLIGTISHSAMNQSQEKINTVKKVYAEFIHGGGDEQVLRHYGSKEFRQILRQLEAISDRYEGEQCAWQGGNVIIPGQDHDLKPNQIRYSILQNGRIRAEANNFGEKFAVDYDVQCTALNCSIADVFTPQSYKKELATYARKGKC